MDIFTGLESKVCGEEVVAALLGSLEALCREMRWLIYRYSHRKEPRTQVSPILLARGNSYAKHGRGRWIARSFVGVTLFYSIAHGQVVYAMRWVDTCACACMAIRIRSVLVMS